MDVLEEAAKRGLYSLKFWAAGKQDPTGLHWLLATEELFWGCAGIGLQLTVSGLALAGLASAGTPDQVVTWAPECFGSPGDIKLGALAVSEPDGGSTSAPCRPWRVATAPTGSSTGTRCSLATVASPTCTSSSRQSTPTSDTAARRPSSSPRTPPGSCRCAGSASSDCARPTPASSASRTAGVPAENLLGGQDKLDEKLARARSNDSGTGSATLKALERSRPVVAAQAIGVARAAYEYALQYAQKRRVFGRPLIDHPPVAELLADMAVEIDAARLLAWRAAWMGANDQDYQSAEGSMSKLKASEVATRVTEKAVQILGGHGYITDHPVEKWYRDAKVFDIYEGTSQIQRLVIARSLANAQSPLPLRQGHG